MPSDPKGSFTTHSQYIRAFSMLAGVDSFKQPSVWLETVAGSVRESAELARAQAVPSGEKERALASLRNAWGSEMLLALGARYLQDDDTIRLSNNWNVVMTYYIAFHATHALIAARGGSAPGSHEALQSSYQSMWVRRGAQLNAFSLGYGSSGLLNTPAGHTVDFAEHPWSTCTPQNCASLAAKALRSTHKSKVDDALESARREKKRRRDRTWREEDEARKAAGGRALKRNFESRPNLTGDERSTAAGRVRDVSILDYLYRLRLRSNYQDATMFTEGPQDEVSSFLVRTDLISLSSSFMLFQELFIARALGQQWLRVEAERWVEANLPSGGPVGVAQRIPVIAGG